MPSSGTVIAFAGAIGSGKSNLSSATATLLNWPRISFGDYVGRVARENGMEINRETLQKLGQALVVRDVNDFVSRVLGTEPRWQPGGNLILDGLRHVEVRQTLISAVTPSKFKLVFVASDEPSRRQRARELEQIDQSKLIKYDQDITEAQIPRILPAYADYTVSSDLPAEIVASAIVDQFNLVPDPRP